MAMDLTKSRNAGKMKQIQEKSAEQTNGLITLNIALDQIDENPDNANIFNMDNIDTLAEGIKEDGFMGAINVFQKPDGRYEISSGHRRYRAMKLLGRDTIPCNVSPYPDDVERGLKLISSNIRNRELKPLDWARAIDYYENIMKLKGEYEGRLRDRAAEYFKMAPTNIHRYTSLLKLIPELQELANDPEYAYSAFTTAATLSEDDQKLLYDTIIKENNRLEKKEDRIQVLSRTRIEQLINDIKHKDDNLTGQQNKTDGNYVLPQNYQQSDPDPYATKNHIDAFNDDNTVSFENGDSLENTFDESSHSFESENDDASFATDSGHSSISEFDDFDEHPFDDNVVPPQSNSEERSGIVLDARLSRIANEIENLSKSDFNVIDDAAINGFISRIKTAVENIERSI